MASALQTLVSMAAVFGIAFALGFRSSAGLMRWLGAAGLLAFVTVAPGVLGLAFGLAPAKTVASASNGPFPLILLPLVGSGIVPTSTMPAGLRYFAEYQPFSPMINTLRGLLLGTPDRVELARRPPWCGGVGLLGLAWSVSVFSRRRTVRRDQAGCHSSTRLPSGSVTQPNRPTPSISCGSPATSAPLARSCASIASRSRTRKLSMACWARDPK